MSRFAYPTPRGAGEAGQEVPQEAVPPQEKASGLGTFDCQIPAFSNSPSADAQAGTEAHLLAEDWFKATGK